MYKLMFIGLFMIGCAETERDGIDPKLLPYVKEIEINFKLHTGRALQIDIPVNFKEMDPSGKCRKERGVNGSVSEVFINPQFFKKSNGKKIHAVLLHEIGHCMFNRDHLDGNFSTGEPLSIMKPVAEKSANHLHSKPDYYYKELLQ